MHLHPMLSLLRSYKGIFQINFTFENVGSLVSKLSSHIFQTTIFRLQSEDIDIWYIFAKPYRRTFEPSLFY